MDNSNIKVNIPEGYQRIMPYLIVKEAAAFIDFMKEVFGAEEKMKMMRDEETIMHAEIVIGESVIMIADATEQYAPRPAGLFIYVAHCDSVYKKALNKGAETVSEPADQQYGRSAGIQDAFGNTWWITSL
jgi:PhnB protein